MQKVIGMKEYEWLLNYMSKVITDTLTYVGRQRSKCPLPSTCAQEILDKLGIEVKEKGKVYRQTRKLKPGELDSRD